MIRRGTILFLALGHGLNDLLAGYFLGRMVNTQQDLLQAGLALLVYNVLAFGGQYPVALWLEKYPHPRHFLLAAGGLNVLAAASFAFVPSLSVVAMGAASALYHVAGGTVCAADKKAANIGFFAAPGVAGLILGGYLAFNHYMITLPLLAVTVIFLALLWMQKLPESGADLNGTDRPSLMPDRHDLVMILLLTVISLRSAVWNIFQLIHEQEYDWLLAIAGAAFTGKILGGWLADRVGWRLYMFASLIAATPLVTFFRNELLLFCIGIGLLQSGIPATTALLIRSVDGKTGRGISLSFGVAIIAGAAVFCLPGSFYNAGSNQLIGLVSALLALIILFMYFSGAKGKEPAP